MPAGRAGYHTSACRTTCWTCEHRGRVRGLRDPATLISLFFHIRAIPGQFILHSCLAGLPHGKEQDRSGTPHPPPGFPGSGQIRTNRRHARGCGPVSGSPSSRPPRRRFVHLRCICIWPADWLLSKIYTFFLMLILIFHALIVMRTKILAEFCSVYESKSLPTPVV